MKISIPVVGSRGDVQPIIALGTKLQQSGHQVKICTHANFESLIRNLGLDFALMESNPQAVLESELGKEAANTNFFQSFSTVLRAFEPALAQVARECWEACQGSEAIIHGGIPLFFTSPIARALKVPEISTFVVPVYTPTPDVPCPYVMPYNLGGPINFLTYLLADFFVWQAFGPAINRWRKEQLGLPPVNASYLSQWHKEGVLTLYGFSPQILPIKDLGPTAHITGIWQLEDDINWQPPPELKNFLATGTPPISFGFGSMHVPDPQEKSRAIIAALEETGQRGVILRGWGGLGDGVALPPNIISVDYVPHNWLFPQMAAVVHQGGAGTYAAGLRAGKPTIVVPFVADQNFWGQQAVRLGVGVSIPRKEFSAAKLANAIRKVTSDKTLQANAHQIGLRMQQEDGVNRAVDLINQYLMGKN